MERSRNRNSNAYAKYSRARARPPQQPEDHDVNREGLGARHYVEPQVQVRWPDPLLPLISSPAENARMVQPVSQEIEYGPAEGRSQAFDEAIQAASEQGVVDRWA